jgi:hypothetical protein
LHPEQYEINWKVLKKRLKKDQAGLERLKEEWVTVNPLNQERKKNWEFLGLVSKGTTTEVPELQEDQEEVWIETPGNSGWRPLDQAEEEIRAALDADPRVMLNHRGVYDKQFELESGYCVHVNNSLHSAKRIVVWDLKPFASELSLEEAQSLLKRRFGWIRRGRITLLKDEKPWTGWDISGASIFHFAWKDKILCKCDGEETMIWGDQVKDWTKAYGDRRVTRNNMPWDEVTILPGDTLEIHQRQRGGSSPKKYRDPFSTKHFNPRMARRKRVEAAARALREQHHTEKELEESIKWKSTSVTYE